MTLTTLRLDLVVLACAVSAGMHAALVPDHLEEGTGAGLGFLAAAVLLGALAIVLARSPTRLALVATAAVLAGSLVSYLLVLTTGFPVLHPEVEPVDGLALFTKAVELLGLATALTLAAPASLGPALRRAARQRRRRRAARVSREPMRCFPVDSAPER